MSDREPVPSTGWFSYVSPDTRKTIPATAMKAPTARKIQEGTESGGCVGCGQIVASGFRCRYAATTGAAKAKNMPKTNSRAPPITEELFMAGDRDRSPGHRAIPQPGRSVGDAVLVPALFRRRRRFLAFPAAGGA